jgi:hypothetical protein
MGLELIYELILIALNVSSIIKFKEIVSKLKKAEIRLKN